MKNLKIFKDFYLVAIRFIFLFFIIFILSVTISNSGINLFDFFTLSLFCLLAGLLISLLFIPLIIFKKDLKIIFLIIDFLIIFGLIRVLFFPAKFGILDGTEYLRMFTKLQILKDIFFIFLSFIISWFVVSFLSRKKINYLYKSFGILFTACLLFSFYLFFVSAGKKEANKLPDYRLLGKKKNIIVVILDSAQGSIFEKVMKNQKLQERFTGFTLYDNATSSFPMTNFSVPLMLSGDYKLAEKATFPEILNKTKNNSFITDAEKKDYKSWRIPYTTDLDWLGTPAFAISNLNDEKKIFTYFVSGIARFAPVNISSKIISFLYLKFNTLFDPNLKNKIPARDFLVDLSKKIEIGDFDNSIIVHHSYLVHPPAYWDSDGKISLEGIKLSSGSLYTISKDKETIVPEGEYAMSIFADLFDKLKAQGIWNNSLIIVLGDHGDTSANKNPELFKDLSYDPTFEGKNWRSLGVYNPAIFIKEPNSNQKFSVSNLPISLLHIRKIIDNYIENKEINIKRIVEQNDAVLFLSSGKSEINYKNTENFQTILSKNGIQSLKEIFATQIKTNLNPTVVFNINEKYPVNGQSYKTLFGKWIFEDGGAWIQEQPVYISGKYKDNIISDKVLSMEMYGLTKEMYGLIKGEKHFFRKLKIAVNGIEIGVLDVNERKNYDITIPKKVFNNKTKEINIEITPLNSASPTEVGVWQGDYLLSAYLFNFTIQDTK